MKFKGKRLIFIMIAVVIICLIFTWIILKSFASEASAKAQQYWFFQESIKTGQPITLENAFLVSNSNGQLVFVHENEIYQVEGKLEESVFGITDIVVKGDDIVKVYQKPDSIEGILESYTEDSVFLSTENNKDIKEIVRNDNVPVYRVDGSTVKQEDWNSFMVGISNIKCVIEEGTVCAILIEEDVLPSDIRVIVKNGNGIFYDELYVKKASDDLVIQVDDSCEITDSKGLYICNSTGTVLGDKYEGSFKIINSNEGFVLVNELPIETYLKYVVPSEMPVSFGEEALKCQAVCARTFAYSQMYNQSYAMYGANLDDSTSFQVYHNTGRNDASDAAVDATVGEVISRNGELITAYYYSSNPNDSNSPFCQWTAYLDEKYTSDSENGVLKNIKVLSTNEDGYATEVEFVYENATKIVKNEYYIRKEIGIFMEELVLNNESVRTDLTILPSAYFTVTKTNTDEIIIKGGGFGHGLGMSQYGAKALAEKGYSYKDIIKYYYDDVVIKSL